MKKSIIECLHQHRTSKPNHVAFRFLSDTGQSTHELTFKELWHEAQAVAKFLIEIAEPASRIMLFYPPGLDYIKVFYGCIMAGMVAVPLYPPKKSSKSTRIFNVAKSCTAQIALTIDSEMSSAKAHWQQHNKENLCLTFYATDHISTENQREVSPPKLKLSQPAFLQYTSGSTGSPKGVIITHGNIIGNVEHLTLTANGSETDVFVNWLPLFHDLGLITAILWPVYLGSSSTLMAPATFVRNPIRWLKAIADYKGTMCGAPNFAYDLCYKKIKDEQLTELDLSTWRVAYNAAEPVNAATLNNFTHRFGSCGFTANRFYPGYGMAEATVFITGGVDQDIPNTITVDKQCLANHKIKLIEKPDHHGTTLVSCGKAALPHDVRVVDPDTSIECSEGLVGEIWFSGPSVSPGYWQLTELSKEVFGQAIENKDENQHRYLRTGDLGVMWDGELYVTGRIKDLIILNGINYYPQDLEESTVNAHQSVRSGYVAAFSIVEGGNEKLIIVTELERKFFRTVDRELVIDAIHKQVFEDHQITVDRVVLLKPYAIPKTSSGKIQRNQTRSLLLNNDLDVLADSNSLNEKEIVKPNTKVERIIHKIWCDNLKQNSICVTDNFFDIGGDSIMAIEISAEIDKAYKELSFDMDKLLELATVKEISQYIELKILYEERNLTTISSHSSGVLKI